MQLLKGLPVVHALAEKFTSQIAALKQDHNIVPTLAIVRIGEREDDLSYERGAVKRFAAVGAQTRVIVLSADCPQEKLEETILSLNNDDSVHGILLFRPLPKPLSDEKIKKMISREKDIDCMGLENTALVFAGDSSGYPPCTPQAVIELLDYYGIDLRGKKVTVVGRSLVVGKPLSMLLLSRNATVTICHTKTLDLAAECRSADILIAAAGVAKMIKRSFVSPGQVVIDVGINMVDGQLCGDVDFEPVSEIVSAITPVPGGVGTVTTSVLLKHTVENALRQAQ